MVVTKNRRHSTSILPTEVTWKLEQEPGVPVDGTRTQLRTGHNWFSTYADLELPRRRRVRVRRANRHPHSSGLP
jgi:hypothetical protein